MTPEEKNMLERTLKLAEDNNSLLRKINRRARTGQILQVFYWLIILGVSFGAYYLIQPYVNEFTSIFAGGSSATSTSSFNIKDIENLFKSLPTKQ